MAAMNRSIVMSVFEDDSQAQKAMNDLQGAGFSTDQIRYSVHRGGTGITGTLENLGLPDQEADFYNREFEAGHTVVMVRTDDRQQEAFDILSRDGGYDYNSSASRMGANASTASTDIEGEQRLKLREEQLRVQKQSVETGEARLHKDVVTEQKSMDIPATHEEVYIERRPGSGQPSDHPIEEGETYRVPVREEQVTVEKQPVVREEVSLGKRPVQETKQVSDTVRREEAHVEREGDVDIKDSNVENQEG